MHIHSHSGIDTWRHLHQCWLREADLAGRHRLLAIPVLWVRSPTRAGSVPLCLCKRDSSPQALQPCSQIVRHPEQHFFIIIQSLTSDNHKAVGGVRLSSWAFTTLVKSFALKELFPIPVSDRKLKSFACSENTELTCRKVPHVPESLQTSSWWTFSRTNVPEDNLHCAAVLKRYAVR